MDQRSIRGVTVPCCPQPVTDPQSPASKESAPRHREKHRRQPGTASRPLARPPAGTRGLEPGQPAARPTHPTGEPASRRETPSPQPWRLAPSASRLGRYHTPAFPGRARCSLATAPAAQRLGRSRASRGLRVLVGERRHLIGQRRPSAGLALSAVANGTPRSLESRVAGAVALLLARSGCSPLLLSDLGQEKIWKDRNQRRWETATSKDHLEKNLGAKSFSREDKHPS